MRPAAKRLVAYVVAARRAGARCVGAAGACGGEPAGLHGAGGVCGAGAAAAHAERQARPPCAAGAGSDARSRARRRARRTRRCCARCLREVLGLERVGIDDNFFALGGDSIMSIQLVSRARRAGLLITPRAVFQHQTVAALAAVAGVVEETASRLPDIATGRVAGDADHALADRAGRADRSLQPGDAAAGAGGAAGGCT